MRKTIKVTKTQRASPDGIQVLQYQEGETYEMPASLADVFLREGWGTEVKASAPAETKAPEKPAAAEKKPAAAKKEPEEKDEKAKK